MSLSARHATVVANNCVEVQCMTVAELCEGRETKEETAELRHCRLYFATQKNICRTECEQQSALQLLRVYVRELQQCWRAVDFWRHTQTTTKLELDSIRNSRSFWDRFTAIVRTKVQRIVENLGFTVQNERGEVEDGLTKLLCRV